jgi:hypothetical protein
VGPRGARPTKGAGVSDSLRDALPIMAVGAQIGFELTSEITMAATHHRTTEGVAVAAVLFGGQQVTPWLGPGDFDGLREAAHDDSDGAGGPGSNLVMGLVGE